MTKYMKRYPRNWDIHLKVHAYEGRDIKGIEISLKERSYL